MGAGGDRAARPSYGELEARIAELEALVVELRGRLDQNSSNSSKPPSSDGYSKPSPKKRSLRRSSGRKQGGQRGHEGAHLERVEVPDRQVVHVPDVCEGCGGDLCDAEVLEGGESRQVFDIPEELALEVIEHVAKLLRCGGCGRVNEGRFPEGVGAPVQYGSKLRALGVYMVVFQHLPYERACRFLADLLHAEISTGTLCAWVTEAAAGLTDFDEQLRVLLARQPVAHFDETGLRVACRLKWVHCASTETLTRYTVHEKRGTEAMNDAGVLPGFRGVAVHDGYGSYRTYTKATHALCAGHHLRELVAAEEDGQRWASGMSCLLLDTKDLVDRVKAAGKGRLAPRELAGLHDCYREIIASGYGEHPCLAGGRIKRTKSQNLLLRLDRHERDATRFAHDFTVSFTNNLCEQDIRMVKLQQKISGCFRTKEGAERFLAVRSYISTARKQGQDTLGVLSALAQGTPWLPDAGET